MSIKLKWFADDEFIKISNCNRDITDELKLKLDKAREYANTGFKIVSAYRSVEYNEKVGGVDNSAHTTGKAVDIAWDYSNKIQVAKILKGLYLAGFKRIGLANTFVHCDIDETKPDAEWIYK